MSISWWVVIRLTWISEQIEAADLEINKLCLHFLDYDSLDLGREHLFDHMNYSDHSFGNKLVLFILTSRINPLRIANGSKFPGIYSKIMFSIWEICSKYISFNGYSFIYICIYIYIYIYIYVVFFLKDLRYWFS